VEKARRAWPVSSVGRALDGTRQFDPRGHSHLAEDVANVRLDGLRAQEELGGDLRVRSAVGYEARDLVLASGERGKAVAVERGPGSRAAVHAASHSAQVLLCGVAAPECARAFEGRSRVLELFGAGILAAARGERPSGQDSRQCRLDHDADALGRRGGREGALGGVGEVPVVQCHQRGAVVGQAMAIGSPEAAAWASAAATVRAAASGRLDSA
jgi:hypothetical protein